MLTDNGMALTNFVEFSVEKKAILLSLEAQAKGKKMIKPLKSSIVTCNIAQARQVPTPAFGELMF